MTRRRLDGWIVEDMVRSLEQDPDICLVLNPSMRPQTGMPRVAHEGKRIFLHRYLLIRATGENTKECLLAACPTPNCLNPFHFERSMRRGRRIRTHCPNGHEYTPDNIKVHGDYKCKQCQEDARARRRKGAHGRGYCRKGHRLTKSNTYLIHSRDGRVTRVCRTCRLDNMRRYRERKNADG